MVRDCGGEACRRRDLKEVTVGGQPEGGRHEGACAGHNGVDG